MTQILLIKVGDTFPALQTLQGDFEQMIYHSLIQSPAQFTLYDPRKDESQPALENFDAVIITGSHAMVTNKEDWSEALLPYIREMQQRDMLVLAICYGHQLVAKALGGESGFHPKGPEPGTVEVMKTEQGEADQLFSALPMRFQVNVAHSQTVLQKPSAAVVLAANSFEPHQALRIGNIWTVQFHPEFNRETTQFYVREISDQIREHGGDVDTIYNNCQDTPDSELLLKRFVAIATSIKN